MDKKKETKILKNLVFEDLSILGKVIGEYTILINEANSIANEFEKLDDGQFTLEIYEDLIENGTKNILEKFLENTKNETERLKIKNPVILEAMLSGSNNVFKPLEQLLHSFINKNRFGDYLITPFSLLPKYGHVTFEHNRFKITEANKENFKEKYCRVYATTVEQNKAIQSLKSICQQYGGLIENVSQYNPKLALMLKTDIGHLNKFINAENENPNIIESALELLLNKSIHN